MLVFGIAIKNNGFQKFALAFWNPAEKEEGVNVN